MIAVRDTLERAVLALAQPADVQLSLFPDFVCKGDELALDFEDGLYELVGHESEFSDEALASVDALNSVLSAMSGPDHPDFWSDEGVRTHPTWEEIRTLAKACIAAFGWELRPPPSNAVYVPAGPERPRTGGGPVAGLLSRIRDLWR